MSTPGFISIYSENKKRHLVTLMSHYDGYPEGIGVDLADFLDECQLVDGIPGNSPKKGKKRYSNGMDCLAAQIITHFKGDENNAGGYYIVSIDPNNPRNDMDYCYEVYSRKDTLMINFYSSTLDEKMDKPVWSGPASEFRDFVDNEYNKLVTEKYEEDYHIKPIKSKSTVKVVKRSNRKIATAKRKTGR